MPVALLITLVGITLSAGVSNLVIGQISDSRRAAERVAAVSAAQAGLDAGLARIKSAADGVAGDLGALPCETYDGTLSNKARWSGSMAYFVANPASMINTLKPVGDLTNVTRLKPENEEMARTIAKAVACVDGTVPRVPVYALLRATGTVGGTTRTLYATYMFRNTNETISGGKIVIAGGGSLCLGAKQRDLDEEEPVKPVYAVSCDTPATTFLYPKDLSLELEGSAGDPDHPYGLCVTTPPNPQKGDQLTFTACTDGTDPRQMFAYEVDNQTFWSTTDGVKSNNLCLNVDLANRIVLANGGDCNKAGVAGKSFVPETTVGAGRAGAASSQYVNLGDEGRCLDLTNQQPDGASLKNEKQPLALISYPCKQTFTGSAYWNHRWAGPQIPAGAVSATGQISMLVESGGYRGQQWCMRSPGTPNGYVFVVRCDTGGTDLRWTVYGPTQNPAESYRIVDYLGNCLMAAGKLGPGYVYRKAGRESSFVVTAPCSESGDAYQKWNAPQGLPSGLRSIQEQ